MLLVHLLAWRYQPEKRTPSWGTTIRTQRREIVDLLKLSPGLKPERQARLAKACAGAREDAADKTGLPLAVFPAECSSTLEQVEDPDFTANSRDKGAASD